MVSTFLCLVFSCVSVCVCASFPFCVTFCILRQLFGAPFFKKTNHKHHEADILLRYFLLFLSLFSPSPLQPGSSRCSVLLFFDREARCKKIAVVCPSGCQFDRRDAPEGRVTTIFLQCIFRLKSWLMLFLRFLAK